VDSTDQNPPESYEMLNHKWSAHVKEDQFRGCMLGGAVGDALGGPVEFMTLAAIKAKFGADGITEFAPAYGKTGAITDDTQMTLFTAEGVIRYWHGGAERSIQAHFEDVLRHSYLRWLTTQGMATKNSGLAAQMQSIDEGWLLTIPELHHQRAPGTTCLNALIQGESIVGSKGCGGVMRVAPVGLLLSGLVPDDEIFDYGCQAAKITHGHPAGYLSGGFLAVVISQILKGKDLIEAVDEATKILIYRKDHQEVLEAVQAAVKLASSNPCTSRGIESLGEGWVAEEALAMGIYSSLMAEDFRHGIILAVNHGGDSDSTGSIAGQVLGAIHGVTAIPDDWLNSLELRDTIDVIGRDLYSVNESPFVLSHSLVHRYPPN